MVVAVLGHRGMLGRRVMERFPDAATTDLRAGDAMLEWLDAIGPEWVIDCMGAVDGWLWYVNAVFPHMVAERHRLIYPSTDHYLDDTPYAVSKRRGECGTVIRCAIVDPEGGMLKRARTSDTKGDIFRQWNGITARAWAGVAADVVTGRITDTLIVPGSPTINHYDVQQTARDVFRWSTRTLLSGQRRWAAAEPTLMLPHIADQFEAYL